MTDTLSRRVQTHTFLGDERTHTHTQISSFQTFTLQVKPSAGGNVCEGHLTPSY